jgi:hypothetical protein
MRRWSHAGVVMVGLVAFATIAPAARADGSRFGAHDIRTLFAIGKNLDKNEVQYGIRLDKDCLPVGDEPIYAYWRQFEQGPEVTEDLNFLDKQGYGIKGEWVTKRGADGSKVLMTLRATADRGIAVIVKKNDAGKCTSETIATINGAPARLGRVFVHVAGLLSVDWVELRGTSVATGQPAIERVKH